MAVIVHNQKPFATLSGRTNYLFRLAFSGVVIGFDDPGGWR